MANKNSLKNQFVVNFSEPTSYGYTAVVGNYFVEEVLKKKMGPEDLKSNHIFFRLFRTGILGDILYKKGEEDVATEESTAETEFLATIFESYMFFVRTIYDYMLYFLEKEYGIKDNSFQKFILKVKNGKYPEITGKFKEHLESNKFFEEIRSLRDSIKRQTPYIFIYVKDRRYQVSGTIYKRNGEKEDFDESLHLKIFGYSTAMLLLMSYMAENIAGVSLKEQLAYSKKKK